MAKLTPKELGRKAAEREFAIGPQEGFWRWQSKLPAEQWDEALQSYERRRAVLEEQARTPQELVTAPPESA